MYNQPLPYCLSINIFSKQSSLINTWNKWQKGFKQRVQKVWVVKTVSVSCTGKKKTKQNVVNTAICTESSHFKCFNQGQGRGSVTSAESACPNLGAGPTKRSFGLQELFSQFSSGGRSTLYEYKSVKMLCYMSKFWIHNPNLVKIQKYCQQNVLEISDALQ